MKGTSRRQTSLGWNVLRVHYTADPDKDPGTPSGQRWYAHARQGVKDRDWRKEYEIDYRALGGMLVFPEYDPTVHITENRFPLDPREWTVYQGADPHPRRAHAFVWLAINRYGDMVVPWSYWPEELNNQRAENGQARLTITEYAELLKEVDSSRLGLAPWLRVMDQAGKNFDADEGVDYFQKYSDCGITFEPAKKNRDLSGYNALSEVLVPKAYEDGAKPTLTIWAGCGDNDELAEQIRILRFREFRGNVPDKDPPAEPEQKRKHLVDCLMYILLHGPDFIDRSKRPQHFDPIYPNLAY